MINLCKLVAIQMYSLHSVKVVSMSWIHKLSSVSSRNTSS